MINIYNFIIHDYFFLGPVVLFGPVAGPVVVLGFVVVLDLDGPVVGPDPGPVAGPVVVLGFVVVLGLTGPVVGPDPGPDVAVVVYFINYLLFAIS
jgi:hypothetical protein